MIKNLLLIVGIGIASASGQADEQLNIQLSHGQTIFWNGTYYSYSLDFVQTPDNVGAHRVKLITSTNGVNWTFRNIALSPSGGAGFDATWASFPGACYDGSTQRWYLVYEAYSRTTLVHSIGYATATSPLGPFTKRGQILSPLAGTWEQHGIGTPSLECEGGTFRVFYHGHDLSATPAAVGRQSQIGLASGVFASGGTMTSVTRSTANPVIRTEPNTWEEGQTGARGIVKRNNIYYMVYEACNRTPGDNFVTSDWSFGLASSRDLVNWTKFNANPVHPMSLDGMGFDGPQWLTIGGTHWAYFRGPTNNQNTFRRSIPLSTYSQSWEAEIQLQHQVGASSGDGWQANVANHNEGFMAYGPYTTSLPVGDQVGVFRLRKLSGSSPSNAVYIDVYDATSSRVLASRFLTVNQLSTSYKNFCIPFRNTDAGNAIELRVYWYKTCDVRLDRVTSEIGFFEPYEAESPAMGHQTGQLYSNGTDIGWEARTDLHNPGFMIWGPQAEAVPHGSNVAAFNLMIDNRTADQGTVARVEVYNSSTQTILASRTILRNEFPETYRYHYFALPFSKTAAKDRLEFRTWYYDVAYIRQDKVVLVRGD